MAKSKSQLAGLAKRPRGKWVKFGRMLNSRHRGLARDAQDSLQAEFHIGSVVAQEETLALIADLPRHTVPPHQHVLSS